MQTNYHFSPFLFIFFLTTIIFAQDFDAFQYRTIGPARGGRVTTVTGTALEPGTFYLGASGGGVWKTEDYGTSWFNVSDGFFETPSIGAIEIAQNDANIVYVGTGSDGIRSNIIAGKGIYKSIDAGKTWEHIGLENVGQIGAVEIDPTNNNIVWVAAIGNAFKSNPERGIFKTTDGGKTWEKVLFVSDEVGFADLELLPGNPNVVYAAAWKARRTPWTIDSGGENKDGGIYKSVNGGKDWVKLEEGLPKGLIGKIDLAVSPVDSRILYAVIEAPDKDRGLYKSVDQGKSFTHISDNEDLVNRPFYYTNLELDPTNPDIIYSNANPLIKSTDGGKTWKRMSVPHGDNHDIWLNPNNPDLLIQCNDGGANVSHNGGKTWSTQFNQPTAEIYQVAVDEQYPYWVYGAQQDNTTIAIPSKAPSATTTPGTPIMMNVGGCETGPVIPMPGNHYMVYNNCKGRFSVYSKKTGIDREYSIGASNIYGHNPKDLKYRFQRVAPIHVSPFDPEVVYMGSQFLHRTSNGGKTWEIISPDLTANEPDKQVISGNPITRDITGEEYYSTLYSIRESKIAKGTIWTGSNDGVISVTKDGGKTWKNVTPKKLPKGGRVESVEPSQFNPAKAYIAVERHLLGDNKPYFYKTDNYGESWELISTDSNGIPSDYFARVLREDPVREGLLYAGTEYGMFVSFDDGKNWKKFQQNLPLVPITDIILFRGDLILSTMGRGFWILDNVSTLENLNDFDPGHAAIFKPANTIRYDSPRGGDFPDYPSTSVLIDYYLPSDMKSGVQLDILDVQNKVVASIVSDSTQLKSTKEEVEDMGLNMTFVYLDKKLETKKGINRFAWDLRQKGPWDKNKNRRYKGGPVVPPGMYKAKLTVGGATFEQPFEILIDPRLKDDGVTLDNILEQQQLVFKVIDLLSDAKMLQDNLEKKIKELEKSKIGDAKLDHYKSILKQLKNEEGAYPQPMMVGQISYLYYILSGTDKEPGQEEKERYTELLGQFTELKQKAGI